MYDRLCSSTVLYENLKYHQHDSCIRFYHLPLEISNILLL